MSEKEIQEGDLVIFYDCWLADRDKDYSGKRKKYYPTGRVIRLHHAKDGEPVADIQLPDGRISRSHFVNGLKKPAINSLNPQQ